MSKESCVTLHLLSKSLLERQAPAASLHLSDMRSIVVALQLDGGTERFRALPEVAAHRGRSLTLSFPSPFSVGAPWAQ